MATTTFETMRATQIAQIEALTPTTDSANLFRHTPGERDFRELVDASASAQYRAFAIRSMLDPDLPDVSDTEQEWTVQRAEVVIAYPNDQRYGDDGNRDRDDVMAEDLHQIDNVIGLRGWGNYTDGHAVRTDVGREETDNATLLVIMYECRFWRSV